MASNFAEWNSPPLGSSVSRQNAGFTDVSSDDGSQQLQVERNSMPENLIGDYTTEVPSDDGSPQLPVETNGMVANVPGCYIARGFIPGLDPPCLFSEAPQQPSHGSQQHPYSSGYMEWNRANHAQQAFASSLSEDIGNLEQSSATGLLQDIITYTPNQQGKKRKAKSKSESSRDYRNKNKAKSEEMKKELEMLREENKKLKTDLDNKNRDANDLGKEVQELKDSFARCWEVFRSQQIQTQHLTKLLENMSSQRQENAGLRRETQGFKAKTRGFKEKSQGFKEKSKGFKEKPQEA